MAKKKSGKEDINVTLAKLSAASAQTLQSMANEAQVKVQQLANEATEKSFTYNSAEAQKTREFNAREAAITRQFNSAEAQKNRDWETYMSNTSHQREVADLKAAGLNPVLSVNQGAMSYTSSSASAQAASGQNASAQAESGASGSAGISTGLLGSLAGLAESSMQNKANIHMNKVQAQATKAAAAASAKAMRDAAAVSASAQRYAADRNYAANKYAWDSKMKISKYEAKNSPVGMSASFARWIKSTGAPDKLRNMIQNNFVKSQTERMFKKGNVSYKNLTSYGTARLKTQLQLMHVPITKSNIKLMYLVNYSSSKSAWNSLLRQRY